MQGRPESGRSGRGHGLGPAVILGLALLAAGALGCGGRDEESLQLDPPSGDTPPATEPDLELQPPAAPDEELEPEESDLPGDIPPAVGEADDPAGLAAEGGGESTLGGAQGDAPDAATASGAGTDDDGGRPFVTAFSGATHRGQYLTEQVAMCVQCHSPKDEHGRVIPERRFQGSPIPLDSPFRGQNWAVEAPALAGMAFYTREEAVRLLTEGIARDGEPPRPPMPPFRMNEQDAGAVYDYLASLPRAP